MVFVGFGGGKSKYGEADEAFYNAAHIFARIARGQRLVFLPHLRAWLVWMVSVEVGQYTEREFEDLVDGLAVLAGTPVAIR